MFGFFKNILKPERQKIIDEFTQTIEKLKGADSSVQLVVGHGVNMANSLFFRKFKTVEEFKNITRHEQDDYLKKFGVMEVETGKKDPLMAIGFGLFKMWLVSIITNDDEAMQYFSKELGWLSKVGDLSSGL